MTNIEFFLKLLDRDFGAMSNEEFRVIERNHDIFKMPKTYSKLLNNGAEYKGKVVEMLNNKMPAPVYVMKLLDKFSIDDPVYGIEFKKDFMNIVQGLSNYRLCMLIDRLNFVMREEKVCFFGGNHLRDIIWHEINKVVSDSFGLKYVYEIFGLTSNYGRYKKLNYEAFNRDRLIACLDSVCKDWTCILYEIVRVLANADDEKIEEQKGITIAIHGATKHYAGIIEAERKKLGKVEQEQLGILPEDLLD